MKNVILLFCANGNRRFIKSLYAILFLTLFLCSSFIVQAQVVVKGKVVDESDEALPGVNVLLKGTSSGTTTDGSGNYTIEVPGNDAVLVFSFIGYESEEINVGTQSVINVSLVPSIESLAEVVVVGYGTQRKEAVTGSVASIDGRELTEVPSANISQSLQGRLAGVNISQTSTRPGAEMQIRIRGTRSLNASNDPLVVLDGIPFPGSISDINPNDIKSVDILKDASATAIYGSRGANGVILVTTKSGRKGQEAKFTYNGFYGVKDIFSKYPMMSGPEFVALREEAGQYQNTLDESNDVDTDWQDLLYKKGMITSHDFGVTGGTEKGTYSVNVGYFRDEGVLPLNNYERYSFRASIDQGIGSAFRFGFITNNNYSVTNGNSISPAGAIFRSPIANPYNEDGSFKQTILEQTSGAQWVYTKETLEALGDKFVDLDKAFGTYNTIYGEVDIPWVEGLKYRTNIGLSLRMGKDGYYEGEGVFSGNPQDPSTGNISNSLTTNWAIENLLTYDRTFADKHNINIVGLYSAQENRYHRTYISARNIPSDHFQFYNLGQAPAEDISVDPGQQWYSVSGLTSWMGRVMYSFNDKYMLSATVRSDGSSRLAEGQKWHTYPAVSLGWNISRETFMQNVGGINMLKLRLGYGETSNQSVDPYKTLGLLATRPYNFGSEYAVGNYVSELPNPNLGWEYSTTVNYGVDFAVLNHRLSGTVEYYIQNTKDVLLRVGLPSTSGVSGYFANIGETQNKGFELTLNGLILDDVNGWTWEAGFNIYANRNELVALASGQDRDESNWWFKGHPIDVVYDYKKIGIWQEDDPYLDILEPGGNPGMIKVEYTGDYNSDGTPTRAIGVDDRQVLSLQPDFVGGFNTRVAYKNFDLSAVGAFQGGGILISTLYGSRGYLNTLNARAGGNVKVDYWTPENTGAKYPKPGGVQTSDNPKYGSTLGYFDAGYLKFRTISLGYNFNQDMLDNAGIENLRLYFTVQNPFVMFSPYHKESGMDPETNSYGDQNVAVGFDNELSRLLVVGTNSPATRSFLVGVNLTF